MVNKFKTREKTEKRNIGLFSLILLSLGSMIGSGIFVLLGPGAGIAGKNLPLAFLLAGFLALVVALIYAEIVSAMPVSGSSLQLFFNVYGRGVFPFIVSWLIVLGDVAYGAINALGFAYYAHLLVPVPSLFIAIGVILIFVFLSWRGFKKTITTENIIAVVLTVLLLLFITLILTENKIYFKIFEDFSFGKVTSILAATALIYTAFVGYEDISTIAGRIKKPARTIPWALVLSVILVTFLFWGVSLVGVNLVSPEALGNSKTPLVLIAGRSGILAKILVIGGALLATLSSLVTMILVASRELYHMAKQGFFGKTFTSLNKWKIPDSTLIFVALLILFLVLTGSVKFVAYLGNAIFLVAVILLSLALIQLRKKRPYLERPFKVPFFPWLPLFVAGFCFIILLFVGKDVLFTGLVWTMVGFLLYLISWIDRERIKWMIGGAFLLFLLVFSITLYTLFIL